MVASEMLESTVFLVSAPRRLIAQQSSRYKLATAELPFVVPQSHIRVMLPKAGLADAGLVWLPGTIERVI